LNLLATFLSAVLLLAAGPAGHDHDHVDNRYAPKGIVPTGLVYDTDSEVVAAVAQIFIDTLISGKASLLANMGSNPFSFDGHTLSGRKAIREEWKRALSKQAKSLRRAGEPEIVAYDYSEITEKFGPAPKKFAHLQLKKCWFASITFETRPGLLLIMIKGKGEDEGAGWMVAGITE
jgi:hypothetical protein